MRPETEFLLQSIIDNEGSDLYLTYDCEPAIRINDVVVPLKLTRLDDAALKMLLEDLLTPQQIDDFEATLELNTAFDWNGKARFRVNAYRQLQHIALVLRHIRTEIPTVEALGLPPIYKQIIMQKRGLILVVGQTGCGKSTSLAAMIGHRNLNGTGHIITIEDPIEFIHSHQRCIISQRDVGIDTYSFGMALKNALRQHPDVILIGEIRDRETMEHAIVFAETGHLCLATLHANNASQAIERALNFFPEDQHRQMLLNLSMNLRGIFSQRLVSNLEGERSLAIEILLNEGLIRELIQNGKILDIREVMAKSRERGMQTFDQSLLDLYENKIIDEKTAVAESDNPGNVRLAIKQMTMDRRLVTHGMLTEAEVDQAPKSDF